AAPLRARRAAVRRERRGAHAALHAGPSARQARPRALRPPRLRAFGRRAPQRAPVLRRAFRRRARGGSRVSQEVAPVRTAKFQIGQVVRHRIHPFRGVIFDVDPVFANTEEWWLSIPEAMRPRKDQPFYHLLAENAETSYVAYVSEQNLLPDETGEP